jgi:hypothetical protein
MIKPVIVCIAKNEQDYIKEFIKYHIGLGFNKVYLYDNEEEPTYRKILKDYRDRGWVQTKHFPFKFKEYRKKSLPIQYHILYHFSRNHMSDSEITHVTHIDIDEFICLKKHKNIKDFIAEFITGNCGGIAINWRMFGSNGHTFKTDIPVTERFTKCGKNADPHIKTLFDKNAFDNWLNCHYIKMKKGFYNKTTKGDIVIDDLNNNVDLDVIQINHYRTKTWEECKSSRTRGRADLINYSFNDEEFENYFNNSDQNEVEDLTACNFYKNLRDL